VTPGEPQEGRGLRDGLAAARISPAIHALAAWRRLASRPRSSTWTLVAGRRALAACGVPLSEADEPGPVGEDSLSPREATGPPSRSRSFAAAAP